MLSKEQNDEGCDASFYSAQAPQRMIVLLQLANKKVK